MGNTLLGKVALVTGGGQGVGEGIAMELAREGALLVVSDLNAETAQRTAARIVDEGGKAVPMRCDVSRPDELAAMVDLALQTYGSIDLLVNNAQFISMGSLRETSAEDYELSMATGPSATFRMMKMVEPHMVARGGGVIVNLVSGAMHRWDMSGYGVYAATKSAIVKLTRAAACEWGADGIRVFAIAPFAMSGGMEGWLNDNPVGQAMKASIPLRRGGDCEADIGRTVALLAGPGAPYLTGALIPLDGGLTDFN